MESFRIFLPGHAWKRIFSLLSASWQRLFSNLTAQQQNPLLLAEKGNNVCMIDQMDKGGGVLFVLHEFFVVPPPEIRRFRLA